MAGAQPAAGQCGADVYGLEGRVAFGIALLSRLSEGTCLGTADGAVAAGDGAARIATGTGQTVARHGSGNGGVVRQLVAAAPAQSVVQAAGVVARQALGIFQTCL